MRRAAGRTAGLVCLLLGAMAPLHAADPVIDLGRGPVTVHLPPGYTGQDPTPLVLLLHGYGSSGALQEAYMQLTPLADEFGFLYAHPDGLQDVLGLRFWNATDACCAFFSNPDDSGYLRDLIDAIKGLANVDEARVYLVGHSNGAFMSYRMACDHPGTIAAVAGLAGATWLDADDCAPTEPVHVLQIHGTEDQTILFNGGCTLPWACYPGAIETAVQWARFGACDPQVDLSSDPLDLDAGIAGNETLVGKVETGCLPGGSAELWGIAGGSHVPLLSADFSRLVVEYLFAHPKSN